MQTELSGEALAIGLWKAADIGERALSVVCSKRGDAKLVRLADVGACLVDAGSTLWATATS